MNSHSNNIICLERDLQSINKKNTPPAILGSDLVETGQMKKLEENYKIINKLDTEGKWVHLKSFRDMSPYIGIQKEFFKSPGKIQEILRTFQANQ